MSVPISFGDVEARAFEPLPVGRYPAKATVCEYVPESARSGEPALAWQFVVQGGDYDGRIGFLNTSLQPQARWSTMRILMALGFSEEDIKSHDWDFESPEVIDSIIGRDCIISIGHDMYEGEKRQRVRRVLSPAGESAGSDEPPF